MNEQGLKALENLGAELGAAKAENDRLRGLLTTLRISLNLDDTEYGLSKQEKSSLAADIDAELSRQAEPVCQTMQRPKAECGCPDCGSSLIDWPTAEPTDTYTAVDMDTAAAQGFRDGQAAVEPAPAQGEREAPEVVAIPCRSKDGDWYIDALHPSRLGEHGYLAEGDELMTVAQHERIVAALTHPAQTEQQPVVLEGWRAGVEAVAAMIEKKADDYAAEFGHIDMGALSFGIGHRADIKRDHHSSLVELAEEVRTTLAAPIAQTALNSDCEWCAGAGKDHFGEKCEHCQTAPQPEQSGLAEALEELLAGTGTSPGANKRYGKARAALDAYRAALSAQGGGQ